MTPSFADKVVLVTGASRGIGRAVALAFAGEGASVVLAARSREHLAEVELEVRGLGADALSVPTDVTRSSPRRSGTTSGRRCRRACSGRSS